MLAYFLLWTVVPMAVFISLFFVYENRKLRKSLASKQSGTTLQIGKVDKMTENDQKTLIMFAPALRAMDKWISYMVALKFQESMTYTKPEDFWKAQGYNDALALLLAQVRTIVYESEKKLEKNKKN